MKKSTLLSLMLLISVFAFGQHYKKDGTPDMRYKENKEMYGTQNTYSTPARSTNTYDATPNYSEPKQQRNYDNGSEIKLQDGYMKSNGTYVAPHLKTTPDNEKWNNLGGDKTEDNPYEIK